MLTRRVFLRGAALVIAGGGAAPRMALAACRRAGTQGKKKILIAIFQRGAADGLHHRRAVLRKKLAIANCDRPSRCLCQAARTGPSTWTGISRCILNFNP